MNPGYTHEILVFGINEKNQTYVYDPLDSSKNGWYDISYIWNVQSTDPYDCASGVPFHAI